MKNIKHLLLILTLAIGLGSYGQTTIVNKLVAKSFVKKNDATRVAVQDSLSKEIGFIMKSSLLNRANHTGEQPISSITNLQDSLSLARTNIDNINNQIANPNISEILVETGFTLVGQDLTMNTGWEWKINDVLYTNVAPQVINIPLAATGMSRIDIIVCNTSNTFTRIIGTESSSSPNAPPIPLNTLQATFLVVDDLVIEPPVPTVTSNLYIPKADKSKILVPGSSTTLSAGKFAQTIAFELAGAHTTISKVFWSNNRNSYNGRVLTIKNSENSNVTITHDSNIGLGHPFFFHNGQDYTLEPNEVIEFSYNSVTSKFDMIGKIQTPSISYWTANGNDIYKNNSGNVGINTTTPQNKLDVNSGINGITGLTFSKLKEVTTPTTSTLAYALGSQMGRSTKDSFGNVYVLTYGISSMIEKITPEGVVSIFVSSLCCSPTDIVADKNNNLYVSMNNSLNVLKITPSGTVTTYASLPGSPRGMAIADDGTIYTANYPYTTVSKIATSGTVTNYTLPTGHRAMDVCIDPFGNVYTANWQGGSISKITPGGVITTTALNSTPNIGHIVSDSFGNVYAVSEYSTDLFKFSNTGVLTVFKVLTEEVRGLTIDNENNLYLDSDVGDKVWKITPSGVETSIALTAYFNFGIYWDKTTNSLYASTTGNSVVNILLQTQPKGLLMYDQTGQVIKYDDIRPNDNKIVTFPYATNDNITAEPTGKVAVTKEYLTSTISGKQNTLSLTTTGTSGVATLTGDTLNVPNYTSVPSPITIVNTNSLFSTGLGAGSNSTATYSNFIGTNSGINSTNASNSNFLGRNSGQNSTDAHDSNFLGPFAGADAVEAHNSNFIGKEAGVDAVNAHNSTFIGQWTGYNAMEASYSNLFGYNVGNGSELGTIGSNNIIIGTNISLPTTTVNSINLGGVLFGTGAYSTIIGDPSIVPVAAGRIGVGVVSPSTKLHVYSEAADTSGLRLERLTSTSPTSTGQAIGVDTSGNVVTINGGTSTLETYTEGGQTGYRLSASDPLNYGNIGTDATDFSYSGTASATMGSTGEGSFTTGEENTSSAYGATTFNYKNTNASVEGLIGGANNQSAGYVNHILGTGNDVTGTNITVVGQAANIIAESTASNNIGTSPVFVVGNGTITDASDYVVATRSDALIVRKNGEMSLPKYGDGTITGTPTYALQVDTNGKIIEGALGGGGGTTETASNGLTKTVDDIRLGGTLASNTTIFQNGNYLELSGGGSNTYFEEGQISVFGNTTGRIPLDVYSNNSAFSLVAAFTANKSTTNTIIDVAKFNRTTTGVSGNGIGSRVSFNAETSTGNLQETNSFESKFLIADDTTRSSELTITGANAASIQPLLSLLGTGSAKLNQYGVGTFTGTPAYALQVDASGNIIEGALGGGGGTTETASNGLTKTVNDIQLGGTLTTSGHTLATDANGITLTGSTPGFTYVSMLTATNSSMFGSGLKGSSTQSGYGLHGTTATGVGVEAEATTGIPIRGTITSGQLATTDTSLSLLKKTAGTPANGFGQTIDLYCNYSAVSSEITTKLTSKWLTLSPRESMFQIATTYTGSVQNAFSISGQGDIIFDRYNSTNKTGTPTYLLGTDTNGKVVKTALERPYKVYTALLTQTSTSAPVDTVLENTLGGTLVWSYVSPGWYQATLAGVFTIGKVAIITSNNLRVNVSTSSITVAGARVSNDAVAINSYSSTTLTDGNIQDMTIEIRVYN